MTLYQALGNLQAIGLIYDVAGIGILGVPAMFRMSDEVAAQMGTYYNFNTPFGKALAKSRVDVTAGSILLLGGFGLQAMGLLGTPVSVGWGLATLGILAVLILGYAALGRKWAAKRLFARALEVHKRRQEQAKAAREAAGAGSV